MKSLFYSVLCVTGLLFFVQSVSAESEPNDSRSQANVLTLNGNNSGAIGVAGDFDYWKVTVNKDGKLDINWTSTNGLYVWVYLYDNDATTQIAANYTNGNGNINKDGLSPGTYYLKVIAFFSDQLPTYTISNTLTNAALTVDAEPNGTSAQALTINQNSSATGHIGFYYNLKRDTTDWWKVTTTGDGLLQLKLNVTNGQYVWWEIYDANGTTAIDPNHYTNGIGSYNVDGLAAGTYYIKIHCFYPDGFAPYTLTDSTYAPPVANDVEPNGTKATALTLAQNNSKNGHIGYYYNGVRDSIDWYKLTTNADGRVRLNLTSYNGQYVWWQLYDNNGTTALDNSHYTNGVGSYSVDGLQKGTYYVKIFCFYSNGFASYTLADSLFSPTTPNDVEPNGTTATALTLAPTGSVNGHIGYYYKLARDTADCYKITTTADGMLNLALSSQNGQYVYWQLYDNNGTTLLDGTHYTNGSGNYNVDGLAANTYYVKVFCFYQDGWAPYTLTSTFTGYTYANDGKSNDYAKKAATLNSNLANTGHVGFYLNGARDVTDWWKINYTGNSGALTVTLNFETQKYSGGIPYTYLQIYQDTAAAALFSSFNNGGTVTANLTSLAQGYYYVKVFMFYSDQWDGYSLTPTFTQNNKAQIVLQTATTGTDCTNGSLSYKCTKSHSPYTVQLYRYGIKYGTVLTVNNSAVFSFSNLPPGSYYATAYGDGATGSAKGTSATSVIVPIPTNTSTTKIKANKATLNWDSLACIKYDSIYYRVQGNLTWTKIKTATNHGSTTITGLTASTNYEWQVAHVDTGNNQTVRGNYTAIVAFTTSAVKLDDAAATEDDVLFLYPNPATDRMNIDLKSNVDGKITFRICDVTGKIMLAQENVTIDGANQYQLDISSLASGMYTLQLILSDGTVMNKNVIKARD